MTRIIVAMGFTALFAFAQTCDFAKSQDECEIDITKPPLMQHTFVDESGGTFTEYRACIADGEAEIDGEMFSVLDCSMVESKNGALTEGVTLTNPANIAQNRVITLKQDSVLLRVAGDFVIDSGVRFNTKNAKNFMLEIIEGSNGKSNLILQRGAAFKAGAVIMPEGENSNITLNTYYGGIHEKEFIDLVNSKNARNRGDMETILSVDDVFALGADGESIVDFNGGVTCGPERNPLDLGGDYMLKRAFKAKNASIDAPSNANAVCSVKEGGCFDGIINFTNRNIDEKSYKVATARANINPTYDIFIESGKIISSDNAALKDIMPSAKIMDQNYGKCGTATKVAFEKSVKENYLANLAKGAKAAESSAKSAESSVDSLESLEPIADSSLDSSVDSTPPSESTATLAQNETIAPEPEIEAESPVSAELNAELNDNLNDLLLAFGDNTIITNTRPKRQKKAQTTQTQKPESVESSIESPKPQALAESKAIESAKAADSTPKTTQAPKPDSSKAPALAAQSSAAEKIVESKVLAESTPKAAESKLQDDMTKA